MQEKAREQREAQAGAGDWRMGRRKKLPDSLLEFEALLLLLEMDL